MESLGGKARRFWPPRYEERNHKKRRREEIALDACMVSGVTAFGGMSDDRSEELKNTIAILAGSFAVTLPPSLSSNYHFDRSHGYC